MQIVSLGNKLHEMSSLYVSQQDSSSPLFEFLFLCISPLLQRLLSLSHYKNTPIQIY